MKWVVAGLDGYKLSPHHPLFHPPCISLPGIAVVSATRLWHWLRKWMVWIKRVSGVLTMKIYKFSYCLQPKRAAHFCNIKSICELLDELSPFVPDTVRELNSEVKLSKVHFIWNVTRFRTVSKFPYFCLFCFLLKLNKDL